MKPLLNRLFAQMPLHLLSVLCASSLTFGAVEPDDLRIPEADRKAIEQRAGCFEVSFDFVDATHPKSTYRAKAREFIDIEWLSPTQASLQHVVIGEDPDGSKPTGASKAEASIGMHWREEWTHNPQEQFFYMGKSRWEKRQSIFSPTMGSWRYRVLQIDGSLRTDYVGFWNHSHPLFKESLAQAHTEGIPQWTEFVASADSPLPRREKEAHADSPYDILQREQTLRFFSGGYIEELSSNKIRLVADLSELNKAPERKIIGIEKGWTRFTRIDDSQCASAQEMWRNQKDFWKMVREEWTKILGDPKTKAISTQEDGFIFQFFGMAKKAEEESDLEKLRPKIAALILRLLSSHSE